MLEGINYAPVLYTKNSELDALRNIRDELRPSIFPIISLRPLPRASELSLTINKLIASRPGRFSLDMDCSRYGKSYPAPSSQQFNKLFLHNDGFQYYYQLIRNIDGAIPAVIRCDGDCQFLNSQIDQANLLGRGLVVRIERGNFYRMDDCLDALNHNAEEVCYVVDAGWSNDILSVQPWTYAVINKITDRNPDAEIVVASSSFPSSFSHMGRKGMSSNDDREMFRRMRQSTNANLIYGDWGSTRKSSEPTPMRAVPRIDLAHSNEWLSYRRVAGEDYQRIAQRLIEDSSYDLTIDCWGKELIARLAGGDIEAIKGTARATAARINMHLSVQAASENGSSLPEETPYVDPF